MSLLRQRAIEVSLESTFSARRPAAARAWFVRLTSFDSEAELNEFAAQPSAVGGTARTPTEVRTNATNVRTAKRRGSANRRARSRGERLAMVAGDIGGR